MVIEKDTDRKDLETLKKILDPIDASLNRDESPKVIAKIMLLLRQQEDVKDLQERNKYPDLVEIFEIGNGLLERNGTQITEMEPLNRLRILVFILYSSYISE